MSNKSVNQKLKFRNQAIIELLQQNTQFYYYIVYILLVYSTEMFMTV